MLMFMMIMMGAQPLLESVMEEKSQRIAEVMLGSVEPFQFMLGKLLGGVSRVAHGGGRLRGRRASWLDYMDLDEHVPYHLLPWFVAYMVLAILMFGALFAALGSACNDATEAQSDESPGHAAGDLPVVRPDAGGHAAPVALRDGALAVPALHADADAHPAGHAGGIPAWQPWVGLAWWSLTTLLFVWAGGRIFRVGILMQGTPPKLRNLIRWALRKQS